MLIMMQDWADDTERLVAKAAIEHAPMIGWNAALVARATRAAGLTRGDTQLLLPSGARDLAALLAVYHDNLALTALSQANPTPMKIRDRIRTAVVARLDTLGGQTMAIRRWAAFLSWPSNVPLALRLVWATADGLWRWAGDTATDENHYSKRAILSEILVSTLALDVTVGRESAMKHLDGRIDAVMVFEKWKVSQTFRPAALAFDIAQALGRLRYR